MRTGFRNDYAYALIVREWVDSKDRVWFAGFAMRSNEPYKNEGVASFSKVVADVFEPQLKPFSGYDNWFRGKFVLSGDVWVDITRQRVKRKRELFS